MVISPTLSLTLPLIARTHLLLSQVSQGLARPDEFKFFTRYAGWGPGQLENECAQGVWYPVAASHDVVLSPTALEGVTMWHTVLEKMGGAYQEMSRAMKARAKAERAERAHHEQLRAQARAQEKGEQRKRAHEGEGGEMGEGGGGRAI